MSDPIAALPDVLVLGAGGTLGEAWLRGLLNGLQDGGGLDFRQCEYLVGTSAGSILAATLAAGHRPDAGDGVSREWAAAVDGSGRPGSSRRLAGAARRARGAARALATPLAPMALAATAPAGRLARAAVLRGSPRPERTLRRLVGHLDSLEARFDGRLRIAAVDRASGRRVMFGAPEAPRATVTDAVLASCAVPWIFAPVEIGGREYVDGGVWSPSNLDTAPAGRGSHVLAVLPTAGAAQVALRALTSATTTYEAAALRARGAFVRTVVPDEGTLDAIGPNLMDAKRREHVIAAGYAQGRRLAAAS